MSVDQSADSEAVANAIAEVVPDHWRHLIPPEEWAAQVRDTSDDYHRHRVHVMHSEEHLVAALEAEAARENPRPERIARLNKRRQEVTANVE